MSLHQAHFCHISRNMSEALNRSGRRVSAITSHSILDRVVIQASSAASNAASVGDTANIPHLPTYAIDA
jgi:hypothetical protein